MLRRCLFLLFFFPLTLLAADRRSVSDLADRVQAVYEQAHDLSIEFRQKTYVALLEKEVSKKGEAQFKKPGKMAIRYEGEHGRQYLSDGKTLWVFESGDKQVEGRKLDSESLQVEALSFLSGLGQLKRDFAVESVDSKKWTSLKREQENLQWMELTPVKQASGLQWLVMGFEPKTYFAREVFLYNESGNLSHYVFDKVELNRGLSDASFQYLKK